MSYKRGRVEILDQLIDIDRRHTHSFRDLALRHRDRPIKSADTMEMVEPLADPQQETGKALSRTFTV